MKNIQLICIDAQNDFCDPHGSLYVGKPGGNDPKGGDENCKRVAKMVKRCAPKLTNITTTMDSHRQVDISHPMWFVDEHGKNPAPFTMITASDMRDGKWRTYMPGYQKRTIAYLEALEARKRYPHVIWPEHCLIGSEGHNIYPELLGAIHEWERKRFAIHDVVTKGSNIWTEHFSAVQAEVPDDGDPSTQVNLSFVQTVEEADEIAWTGEALSHCLANTFRDMAANFKDKEAIKKNVLLLDASSAVPGFEKLADDFVRDMKALGMRTSTTTDWLA